MPFANLNDGSNHAPRLRVGATLWGLQKLPMNAPVEWTLEEKIARVQNAGFEHIECWLPNEKSQQQVPPLVHEHGLKLALGHRPTTVQETRDVVDVARKTGAEFVLCQPASPLHRVEEVARIVTEGAQMAADAGIGYFVETHRNNFTETIPQTLQLIEAVPNIKITADFSHFVVVGEFYGWAGEGAIDRLRPIIEKCAHVHGRISNGEQVQVDVGDGSGGEGTPAGFFRQIWTEIFKTWRQNAKPGDVMPFSSELGPPRYAITLPDGREFSDRWEQSLVMKQLAETAWRESKN